MPARHRLGPPRSARRGVGALGPSGAPARPARWGHTRAGVAVVASASGFLLAAMAAMPAAGGPAAGGPAAGGPAAV
ncbi:MAG: tetratricopeptide repeat protein, partial [Acidimicrobiales bacterium]